MPSLSEELTIPAPPRMVWPLLADPRMVASCIPGATLTPTPIVGVYDGTLRVRLGPAMVALRGEARLAYHDQVMSCTVELRGLDSDGQSRALASGEVHVSGDDSTTTLSVGGDFVASGPLEHPVETLGEAVAKSLLAAFAASITRLVTNEGAPAPDAEEIPLVEPQTVAMQVRAAAAAGATLPIEENRGAAPLWRTLLGKVRQIYPGKG